MLKQIIVATQNMRVDTHDVVVGDELARFESPFNIHQLSQMVRQSQAKTKRYEPQREAMQYGPGDEQLSVEQPADDEPRKSQATAQRELEEANDEQLESDETEFEVGPDVEVTVPEPEVEAEAEPEVKPQAQAASNKNKSRKK